MDISSLSLPFGFFLFFKTRGLHSWRVWIQFKIHNYEKQLDIWCLTARRKPHCRQHELNAAGLVYGPCCKVLQICYVTEWGGVFLPFVICVLPMPYICRCLFCLVFAYKYNKKLQTKHSALRENIRQYVTVVNTRTPASRGEAWRRRAYPSRRRRRRSLLLRLSERSPCCGRQS